MDPIAAFGLASGVLQTIGFSLEIIRTYQDVFDQGSSITLRDLEVDTLRIQECTRILRNKLIQSRSPNSTTAGESELLSATENCVDISDNLAAELAKINLDPRAPKRRKIAGAAKAVLYRSNLQGIHRKLQDCQNTLQLHVLCDLSFRQKAADIKKFAKLESIDEHVQKLIAQVAAGDPALQSLIAVESENTRQTFLSAFEQHLSESRQDQVQQDLRVRLESRELKRLYDHEKQVKILVESVRFPTMMQRQNDIEEPHSQTFEWIFDESTHTLWSSFPGWLKSAAPVYWINGKAGSGKSTLMKFIVQHAETHRLLAQWAHPLEPCVLKHFFWSSGDDMQSSRKGLMSALVYQMMTWKNATGAIAMLQKQGNLAAKRTTLDWSLKELEDCFQQLVDIINTPICIILDGLDEFRRVEGLQTLPNLLLGWSRRSRLKVLVSGRPEQHLERTFDTHHQLRLQDLTTDDIRTVITDRLQSFNLDPGISLPMLDQLVSATLRNSEGVFLWVHFALQSLERGLEGCDDWKLLLDRVEKLPQGIDNLYLHMWRRYNDDERLYREEASMFFQVAQDEHHGLPMSLGLFIAHVDEDLRNIFFERRSSLTWDIVENKMIRCISRIRTRCAGLLEVSSFPDRRLLFKPGRWTVNFFHRTARDFLVEHEEGQRIMGKARRTATEMIVIRARAKLISSIIDRWLNGPDSYVAGSEVDSLVLSIVRSGLSEESQSDLLAMIDCTGREYFVDPFEANRRFLVPRVDKYWYFRLYATNFDKWHHRALPDFVGFVAGYGNEMFVQKFVENASDADLKQTLNRLLHYSCTFTRREPPPKSIFGLIRYLLEKGADPNQESFSATKSFLRATAWAKLLIWLAGCSIDILEENQDSYLAILAAFESRNVAPKQKILLPSRFEASHFRSISLLHHNNILDDKKSTIGVEFKCDSLLDYVRNRLGCIKGGRPDLDVVPWIADSRVLYFTSSNHLFTIPDKGRSLPLLRTFIEASFNHDRGLSDRRLPTVAVSCSREIDLDALKEYLRDAGYLPPSTFVPLPIAVKPEEKAELEEYWRRWTSGPR